MDFRDTFFSIYITLQSYVKHIRVKQITSNDNPFSDMNDWIYIFLIYIILFSLLPFSYFHFFFLSHMNANNLNTHPEW